jgi:hypothetical protein
VGEKEQMSRVAGAFLLFVLVTSVGRAGDPGASAALEVSVSETSHAVLLHIQASQDVEPGSVEIRLAGPKTVVLARDAEGRPIRSQLLRLPESVIEEGASAVYDANGALVMTLRKQPETSAPRPSPLLGSRNSTQP